MRDTVYLLVFDGFGDWESALALCEIRRPGTFQVRTVGFSYGTVESMGGLKVQPDLILAEIDDGRAAMLILPGGHRWMRGDDEAIDVARRLHARGVALAALGGAALALDRAGVLGARRQVGNVPVLNGPYLIARAGTVVASGVGSVEFAREVIGVLDLYGPADTEHWYRLFKHAIAPPWIASAATLVEAAA
jgi:hypothetical protein